VPSLSHAQCWTEKPIKIGSSTEGKRKKESIISIQIKEQLKKKTTQQQQRTLLSLSEKKGIGKHWVGSQ